MYIVCVGVFVYMIILPVAKRMPYEYLDCRSFCCRCLLYLIFLFIPHVVAVRYVFFTRDGRWQFSSKTNLHLTVAYFVCIHV